MCVDHLDSGIMAAASASMIRLHTPARRQRTKRLQQVVIVSYELLSAAGLGGQAIGMDTNLRAVG
jgi:hypothetical protein